MALNKEELLDAIAELSVMELVDLISAAEEKFGVTAAAAAVAIPAAGAGGDAGAAEEAVKDSFDVHLTSFGDSKVNVIRVVRTITGLGLKEAKDMVDGAPTVVKEGASKEEAEEVLKQLQEAGAEVELK